MVHLELIGLFDDNLQTTVFSQDGFPHLSYSPGFLLFSAHLPLVCEEEEDNRIIITITKKDEEEGKAVDKEAKNECHIYFQVLSLSIIDCESAFYLEQCHLCASAL